MSTEMNLIQRIKAKTPPFFKKVRKISLALTAVATTLLTSQSLISGFVLPAIVSTIATYTIVSGIMIAATASTAVDATVVVSTT